MKTVYGGNDSRRGCTAPAAAAAVAATNINTHAGHLRLWSRQPARKESALHVRAALNTSNPATVTAEKYKFI